jgi:hypothetical protein
VYTDPKPFSFSQQKDSPNRISLLEKRKTAHEAVHKTLDLSQNLIIIWFTYRHPGGSPETKASPKVAVSLLMMLIVCSEMTQVKSSLLLAVVRKAVLMPQAYCCGAAN